MMTSGRMIERVMPRSMRNGTSRASDCGVTPLLCQVGEGIELILNDTYVWYGMVWYGMVWYGMVWYDMV